MAFYAKVRKLDNLIVGIVVLDPAQAIKFPSNANVALIEITEAQYNIANSQGLFYDGSNIPKFELVDLNFINNLDTRPTLTFTPSEIKAEVGDIVTVQIDHSDELDGLQELFLAGVPIRIDFVLGTVAAVAINTDNPVEFFVTGQQTFQIPVPLHVIIYSRKIGSMS